MNQIENGIVEPCVENYSKKKLSRKIDLNGYNVEISEKITDVEWDNFVSSVSGGTYLQTSKWGQVETFRGRQIVRFKVKKSGNVVAGAQLSIQSLLLGSRIAYISRGPLFEEEEQRLIQTVFDVLRICIKEKGISYLITQPPCEVDYLQQQLIEKGYHLSAIGKAFTAAVIVDIMQEPNKMLAQMRRSNRQAIKRGLHSGLTIRQGNDLDLSVFYRMHVNTGKRQKFLPLSYGYFENMWRVFHTQEQIKLFLIEYKGEVLSAMLVICFGNTIYPEYFGWSGKCKEVRPNETLFWSIFLWGKSEGYRYCNIGWIDPQLAQEVAEGDVISKSLLHTPGYFKLGFSKQIQLFPNTYDLVCKPLSGRIFKTLAPKFAMSSSIRSLVGRVFKNME